MDVAVEAMRRRPGLRQKPWDNERLLAVVRSQVELGRALRRSQRLEAENTLLRDQGSGHPNLIESAAMQPVLELIARVGPSDANVLLTGENGTGKGTVAQAIHASRRGRQAAHDRERRRPLGGRVRERAVRPREGRVHRREGRSRRAVRSSPMAARCLDEIANISLNLQAKLLRVLETGEFERVGSSRTRRVNVRILSATNADLHTEVEAGRFRQDLLFRLNTIEIRCRRSANAVAARAPLPPAARAAVRKRLTGFDQAAMQVLLDHAWPGNVRELDHAVERAVLMAQGDAIAARDLGCGPPAMPPASSKT